MANEHTVNSYNDELKQLNTMVLEVAHLGQEQLRHATLALKDRDCIKARAVIDRDRLLNDFDIQIDERLVQIIARRQPMARDLRELITIGKVVTDLERVGDEARKIARLTIYLYDDTTHPPMNGIIHDLFTMSRYVDQMLTQTISAYKERDLEKAIEIISMDRELEQEFSASLRQLSTFILEDARNIGFVVEIVLGLRALERIGGHAKNIAGYLIYMVKGTDVRHKALEEIERAAR